MTELEIVLEVGKKYNVDEALVIYTSKIDVRDWVNLKCAFGCEHYSKNWSCPPNSISPEQTRNLLREYTKAVLVIGDNGAMDLKKFRQAMLDMEDKLVLNGFPKSIALSMGPCDICEKCTLPDGKLCRYPLKRRPSVEGMGIDVLSTVKKFKKNLEFLGKRFFSVGIILLE